MPDLDAYKTLIEECKSIAGTAYVLTDAAKMQPYNKGFRLGSGESLAVVKPNTLLEVWQLLKACVAADVVIIMQAANTGLTGGSTPYGKGYDRPIVIISTLRINQIQLLDDAKQIVALPGSTLFGLEDTLRPFGREPHSVIGSSCIGASIVGGICNNSGGALVQRGPAYTELSLFAQISDSGQLELVNNLGIALGQTPEEILGNLQNQNYSQKDVSFPNKLASDNVYHQRVRDVDAATPARFNNDRRRLYESAGCGGKLGVFAVRLDTFAIPKKRQVFYLGTNRPEVFAQMRRDILSSFKHLPDAGEYLNRACYDISKSHGKDTFVIIDKLGSKFIPKLFEIKRRVDRWAHKLPFLPANFSDRLLQALSHLWPNHLPNRMEDFRNRFEHHWILEMSDDGVDEAQSYLATFFKQHEGDYFACTKEEGEKAILHRFVTGGALGRYHSLNAAKFGAFMTVDVALRRNEEQWLETLPAEIEEQIESKFYYGHLFCHVLHQNYILKRNADGKALKEKILDTFDARQAEYPAEHNVGHEYAAKDDLKAFYRQLDPTNSFNPGIGQTSKLKYWREPPKD